MKNSGKIIVVAVSLLYIAIAVFSCRKQNTLLETVHEFSNSVWSENDTIQTYFKVTDSLSAYNLNCKLTVLSGYPYTNISFSAKLLPPDGSIRNMDFNLNFREPQGLFKIDSLTNGFQLSVELMKGIVFSKKGNYSLQIYHTMPFDILPEIQKMTVSISKKQE